MPAFAPKRARYRCHQPLEPDSWRRDCIGPACLAAPGWPCYGLFVIGFAISGCYWRGNGSVHDGDLNREHGHDGHAPHGHVRVHRARGCGGRVS